MIDASIYDQIETLKNGTAVRIRAIRAAARNPGPPASNWDTTGSLDHLIGYLRAEMIDHRLIGIGHRVVYGGRIYTQPVRLDADALQRLEAFIPLAPLHQLHNLAPVLWQRFKSEFLAA